MKEKLRKFVTNELLSRDESFDLPDDQDLLGSGLIDSMGIARLIGFIESEFGISVSPEEMILENFENLDRMSKFISKKQ